MIHNETFSLQPLDQPSSKVRIVLDQQNAYADLLCGPDGCAKLAKNQLNPSTCRKPGITNCVQLGVRY
jgi:hypothetical protein